ncbi:MAG TPA: phage replisome organizer N-terminal domain-containing protein [Vicinamibacterales bacterium]|nr:phage replisome organizer N-terminal domain-containing protein [Vicinamibacterales bacterium]
MGKTWIKLYPEVLDDSKIRTLPATSRLCWFGLLCLAGKYDSGETSGRLEYKPESPLTDEDIAAAIAVELDEWRAAKVEFARRNLVEVDGECIVVTSYRRRQMSMDPKAAERQRRHREKDASSRDVTRDSRRDVTLRHALPSREAEAEYRVPPISPPMGGGVDDDDPFADDGEKPKKQPPSWAVALMDLIENTQQARHPNRTPATPALRDKGAFDIERLHTCDKHPVEEIERVCRWAMADDHPGEKFPGWAGVVQSGSGLRGKWNRIVESMGRAQGQGGNGRAPAPLKVRQAREVAI